MNINELNKLIPSPYRDVNVPETLMYFRSGEVFPITEGYVPENQDFVFTYSKNNGLVDIKETKTVNIPNRMYTPEEWVNKYFTNLQVIALMRLEQNILSQNKSLGPKMQAVKLWLENMLFAIPSNNFPDPPFTYVEISNEASEIISV
jgi:hypothetical protein